MPISPVKKWLEEERSFWDPIFVDRLIKSGEKVICFDNFFIGCIENIEHCIGPPSFLAYTSSGYLSNQS